LKALDERKLHYQSVVAFLHYNRPILFVSDAEEFLFHCFGQFFHLVLCCFSCFVLRADAAGKFSRSAVAWMLWKFGVFKPAEGRMPHLIEKVQLCCFLGFFVCECVFVLQELFPPLPSDVLDEVRRSRDLIMSGGAHNNSVLASPLARSRDKTPAIDVDQIRASADALRNHRCHHEEEEEEEEEEEHK
jgi:hypothetical protein